MDVKCLCGHEDHVEMPFDDTRTIRIACTASCRAVRQTKLERALREPFSRLSDVAFKHQPEQIRLVGMLGH